MMTARRPTPADFAPPRSSRVRAAVEVVVVVVTLMLAFIAGVVVGSWQPDCPTEDSCVPRYIDGRWEVVRTIP